MSKSTMTVFAKVFVKIEADDTDINLNFARVEEDYVDFMIKLDELIDGNDSDLIRLSVTEE